MEMFREIKKKKVHSGWQLKTPAGTQRKSEASGRAPGARGSSEKPILDAAEIGAAHAAPLWAGGAMLEWALPRLARRSTRGSKHSESSFTILFHEEILEGPRHPQTNEIKSIGSSCPASIVALSHASYSRFLS